MAKNSLLQRVIHRLATSDADLESEEMQRAVEAEAAVPIRTCEDRQLVRLRGTVSNVTIHPRGGHPALEVELRDGSGAARLVWLGRREIPGIEPGRTLSVEGRVSCHRGERLMYNPRYELLDGPRATS
jgi:RecJ-like exonuclease